MQHERRLWPNLDQLGVLVEGMPLLPAMAKSMFSKLPKMLIRELEPLLGELSSSSNYPADIIEKFSAINHLLTVDIKIYFFDILECSTVRDLKFLVTNDNKFYQNVAKKIRHFRIS